MTEDGGLGTTQSVFTQSKYQNKMKTLITCLRNEDQALCERGAQRGDDGHQQIVHVGRLARAQHENGAQGSQDHHVIDTQAHPARVVQLGYRHLKRKTDN